MEELAVPGDVPFLLVSVALALGLGILAGPIGLYAVYAVQPDTEVSRPVKCVLLLSGYVLALAFFYVPGVFPGQPAIHALLQQIILAAVVFVVLGAAGLRWYRCRPYS